MKNLQLVRSKWLNANALFLWILAHSPTSERFEQFSVRKML